MSIVNIDKIDYCNINIRSPDRLSHKHTVFNLGYKGKRILFQTPRCIISSLPFLSISEDSNYYKIIVCFYNYSIDKKTKCFVHGILDIEKHIKEKMLLIFKKSECKQVKNRFISAVNINKQKTKAYVSCNIQKRFGKPVISVFDSDKNKKEYTYIENGFKSVNILFLENIWQYYGKYGINLVLLQTKIYHPILEIDKILIKDDDDVDYKTITHDGLTPTNPIQNQVNDNGNINNIPPPPPPPPPRLISNTVPPDKHKINSGMNLTTKPETKKEDTQLVFRPPTKDELVNAISRLKKRDNR